MSREEVLRFIQTELASKLIRAGYSDVVVKASVGDGRWGNLVVRVEAKKGDEVVTEQCHHNVMSMWSAVDVVDCFFGLITRDAFILKTYGEKLVIA
jgi:hypothetical protein